MAEPHWTETEWIQTSTYGHLDVDCNQYRYKWLQQLVNEELYELYNDIYSQLWFNYTQILILDSRKIHKSLAVL